MEELIFYSNPRRNAQIPEERRAAWDKQEKAALDAARERYIAAERAIWPYEKAVREAKFAADEARRDLDEYEKEQRRRGRRMAQEIVNEEKWEQIRGAIAETMRCIIQVTLRTLH